MAEKNNKINIYFVTKNNDNDKTISMDMKQAFLNASNWNLKPQWIKEDECSLIDSNMKGNVFVFGEFAGNFFNNFITTYKYSRIIGPKCLLTCFAEQIAIPNTKSPIYNMAMNGLIISASVKPIESKKLIKELVGFMSGTYTDALTTSTTHLVVSSVLSEKYLRANEEGINVMKSEWINDVWKQNFKHSIKATDNNIIDKNKCTIFHNLNVTASLLSVEEKQNLKKIINDNGGNYTNELQMNITNVLIIPSGSGEKYKFATRWKIICLNPSWIKECLKKKYAVRYDKYIVPPENKCSTPIQSVGRTNLANLIDSNDSEISAIPLACGITIVGDSENFNTPYNSLPLKGNNDYDVFKTPAKNSIKNDSLNECNAHYLKILDNIKMADLKKCPHLFDGCKIYLTGFMAHEEEKLRRILNYGGAIRFTDLNEFVTHIIVGNLDENELQNIKSIPSKPHIVKLEWLSTSIIKGCLEKERNYVYFNENKEQSCHTSSNIQQPSPLSKKGMQMLNPVRQIPVSVHPLMNVDHILIEKYSRSQHSGNEEFESNSSKKHNAIEEKPVQQEENTDVLNEKLFAGLKFSIIGHSSNVMEDIKDTILEFGGEVIFGTHSVADYIIVPFANITIKIICKEIVTSIWIEECLSKGKIVETKYYHRPVNIPDHYDIIPLSNCVITFSSYNIHERQYLENVAAFLGAKCQDVLSKKENTEKGIVRTTHLICSSAQGIKYKAAKKWNLPIIRESWLLECFSHNILLPTKDFILDDNMNICNDLSSSSKELNANKYQVTSTIKNDLKEHSESIHSTTTLNVPRSTSCGVDVNDNMKLQNLHSFRSDIRPVNADRINIATPSITEAVKKSINKNTEKEKQNKNFDNSSKNKWPTGLLLEINACASSSLKRKLEPQITNISRISKLVTESPKKKLFRHENNFSFPCEEVGWQDTLTDFSNIHSGNSVNSNESNTNENINHKDKLNVISINDEKNTNNDRNETRPQMNKDIVPTFLTKFIPSIDINDSKSEIILKKKFLISISNAEKKSQYENAIVSLGGRVFSSFPTDCEESEKATHIVIDELKKTEKLLCSIASGLWVLHPSYIECCIKNQKFISEEKYEWGNAENKTFLYNSKKDYALIANAAYRWRKLIENEGHSKKPFVGMKAVIISSPSDMQSLMRVVKSGGGTILQSYDILNCTHCLLKSVKIDNIPVPLKKLAERNIHCISAVYLSDFLMYDPPPNITNFYSDKYKRLLNNIKDL